MSLGNLLHKVGHVFVMYNLLVFHEPPRAFSIRSRKYEWPIYKVMIQFAAIRCLRLLYVKLQVKDQVIT